MSKDISVLPQRFNCFYDSLQLSFDCKDYDKYEELDKIGVLGNTYYDNVKQVHRDTDYYGDPVRVINVKQFLDIWTKDIQDPFTVWDQANIAFLKTLPDDHLLLILYS